MNGLLVVGFSAGGSAPMRTLLAALGPDYPLPLAMVAHLPAGTGAGFTALLASAGGLPPAFASDKQAIVPGHAWVGPADYHLLIENGKRFALSVDPQVNFVRPSIDVLFESAAQAFGKRLIALTLSGASSDGARGMASVRQGGGLTIALTADACDHRTLADAVARHVEVDYCVGLDEIITLLRAVG
ncbi:CheB methylesterase [Candidatus Accumulibacter aalborgensis]|uniref:protein-glutamate methylesterase n=1 Tax=Candidatus Accumulibacter aalborgensis TaxID=1860102 RepID=A0A1A8XKV5_9PROT|nr:chemotaxis protein CheB [Candidatus Accumulibacter aalborgensis]SBT05311.1 CheB methylesterase [Candidatus Accumulibacter aalborgensis]